MARTLTFTGEMTWPLEDGKQAAKLPIAISLAYVSALAIEKVYAVTATDEAIALPMASAKFLLLQALGNDIAVKLNGGDEAIDIKAGSAGLLTWNDAGNITEVKISVATVPATLKGYAFA